MNRKVVWKNSVYWHHSYSLYSVDVQKLFLQIFCLALHVPIIPNGWLFPACRLVKSLRDRYLHSGSPLELPAETRMRLKLSKSGQLTMQQIVGIQDAMIARLKEYWWVQCSAIYWSVVSCWFPTLQVSPVSPSLLQAAEDFLLSNITDSYHIPLLFHHPHILSESQMHRLHPHHDSTHTNSDPHLHETGKAKTKVFLGLPTWLKWTRKWYDIYGPGIPVFLSHWAIIIIWL